MADLGSAYVNIVPKASGIEKKIGNLLGPGSEAGGRSGGAKAGKSFVDGLKSAAITVAVGKVIKDAFAAGGDLQQSFGGLDTIYGEASAAAKQYAMDAAQAGISANTYAEQAVSFGASLKAAYGGDTAAAMEAANLAILDMADNSAKMGTDMSLIQNAYQGFAKQNYTMLDNLKLGYGGTQAEMQRLLTDAQKISGVKYDISNLGDVYSAIHVIQGELGLTGVAAAEAQTTLTGSFNALKASWENTMAALTTGEGLETALANLSTSVGNFANNILQMLGQVASQVPTFIMGIVDALIANAPSLIAGGVEMTVQLATGFVQAIPQIIEKIPILFDSMKTVLSGFDWKSLLDTLMDSLRNAIDSMSSNGGIADQVIPLVFGILDALIASAPNLISGGFELISQVVAGFVQAIPQIIGAIPQLFSMLLNAILSNAPSLIVGGLELIAQIIVGFGQAIPQLIDQIPVLFEAVKSAFAGVDWASLGTELINGIVAGITAAASVLWETMKSLASSALSVAKSALGIASPSKLFSDEVGYWIPPGIAAGIEQNVSPLDSTMAKLSTNITGDMARATSPAAVSTNSAGSRAADSQKYEVTNNVSVSFEGSLAQLARVLYPYIKTEQSRRGPQLIM